ncbi:MAG: polysaccharide deacetylase family protein [Bacteroidetes bacterium]|nr:polysaccharide deacetylase family protein [Bacteroidota bacterium]
MPKRKKEKGPPLSYRSTIAEKMRYRLHSVAPRLYPGAQCRLSGRDAVALTIDDGPSETTRDLLSILESESLTATFFLSGAAVEVHPDLPGVILEQGNAVASHGFAHASMLRKSRKGVQEDIARSLSVIEKTSGQRPTLYRPPYGRLHPLHYGLPRAQGCRLVLWNVFIGDYDHRIDVPELHRRLATVRGGDILVLHDQAASFDRTSACLRLLAGMLRIRDLQTMTL